MNNIIVRVTKKDIRTGRYVSNSNCPLAIALFRAGYTGVFVTPSYVRIGEEYYDLKPEDNDKLIDQDNNKENKLSTQGIVIELTPS